MPGRGAGQIQQREVAGLLLLVVLEEVYRLHELWISNRAKNFHVSRWVLFPLLNRVVSPPPLDRNGTLTTSHIYFAILQIVKEFPACRAESHHLPDRGGVFNHHPFKRGSSHRRTEGLNIAVRYAFDLSLHKRGGELYQQRIIFSSMDSVVRPHPCAAGGTSSMKHHHGRLYGIVILYIRS